MGVTCRSTVDKDKVFPGEKLNLAVTAENAKFLPVWLQLKVPLDRAIHTTFDNTTLTMESGLLWYQKVGFKYELTARHRGFHRIGPPDMEVGDPFGFFSKRKKESESLHIIVYPRLVPLKSFILPRREFFGVPGSKSPVKDPVYILGTRDYQHGSPAKYIHWKASARHSRLQEKVCEPTEQEKVLLIIDTDQFSLKKAEEEFERTLEVAASLAVRLNIRGYSVGLVANGTMAGGGHAVLPIESHPRQLSALLEILARLQMDHKENIKEILRRDITLPWDASCVYFAYESNGASMAAADFINHRRMPVAFVVCNIPPSTIEKEEVSSGLTYILDDLYFQKEGLK